VFAFSDVPYGQGCEGLLWRSLRRLRRRPAAPPSSLRPASERIRNGTILVLLNSGAGYRRSCREGASVEHKTATQFHRTSPTAAPAVKNAATPNPLQPSDVPANQREAAHESWKTQRRQGRFGEPGYSGCQTQPIVPSPPEEEAQRAAKELAGSHRVIREWREKVRVELGFHRRATSGSRLRCM